MFKNSVGYGQMRAKNTFTINTNGFGSEWSKRNGMMLLLCLPQNGRKYPQAS